MDLVNLLHINPEAQLPLVLQLSQQLIWLIASEVIKEGEQLPTIRELADGLGVHMHTVRAAYHRLQALELVSVQPKRGTIVLPFHPERLIKEAPAVPSFFFGVMMPSPATVYRPYIEGIHRAALESYWLPIISYNFDEPNQTERALRQLLAKGVDGLIITSAFMRDAFFSLLADSPSLPKVFVDAPHMRENSILADTEGAARQSTSHLLEHGYDRVALIVPPLEWENVEPCLRGYTTAHLEAGRQHDTGLIVQTLNFSQNAGYSAAKELLNLAPRPRAVFVAADVLALGALEAFHEAGLRVPDDIAVSSYNDIEAARLITPTLTSATFPAYEMGVKAVELLVGLMNGARSTRSPIVFESHLIVRQSCGCHHPTI